MCTSSGDDWAISCNNLVNFHLVTPNMTRLICVPVYVYRKKTASSPSFVVLAFRNGLEYYNFDFSRLIGNHFSTLFKNLVRFGPLSLSRH